MKRPREHELETKSEAFLLNFFSSWVCNKLNPDYGLDFKITIVKENQVTQDIFFVQNKATDNIKKDLEFIDFDLDVKHLLNFLKIPLPVILILYDAVEECGYWLNLQNYCRNILDKNEVSWKKQKTKRLKIPITNELKDRKVLEIEIKNSLKINMRYFTDSLSWSEGYEAILSDTELLEKLLVKKEIDNIKGRFHMSGLYFQQGDQEKVYEQFFNVYKQNRQDIYHLQSILGLITCQNPLQYDINDNLHQLSIEGISLAETLNESYLQKIFTFLKNYFEYFKLILPKIILLFRKSNIEKQGLSDDFLLKFYIDSEQVELDKKLSKRIYKMQEILGHLLKNKKIFEFFVLFMYIVQKDNSLNFFLKRIYNEEKLKDHFTLLENVLKNSLPLAELIKNDDIYLHIQLGMGQFYESIGSMKGIDFFKKGLKISEERKHLYYQEKFHERIENYGKEIIKFVNEEVFRDMPISEGIIGLKELQFSKIDTIQDPILKSLLLIAKQDSNPMEYLKKCKFLIIGYFPSPLGIGKGIFSLGIKTIMCKKYERWHDTHSLKEGIRLFEDTFCNICLLKEVRTDDWMLRMRELDNMRDLIVAIVMKHQSLRKS